MIKNKTNKANLTSLVEFEGFFIPNILNEEQLLLSYKILNNLMEGIMITEPNGTIKFINPAFTKITGYGQEVLGENPRILKSGKHPLGFYKNIWKSIGQKEQWKGEIWNRKKDGELYIQWSTITVLKNEAGKPIYYIAVISDVTQQRNEQARLQHDLQLAMEVQKSLLSQPIVNEQIRIEASFLPCTMLGGDMYAWYKIDDDRYGIFLMDVMGHGVASALISMSIRSLLRGVIQKVVDPELVMHELNQHVISLFNHHETKYYLTGLYVVIDTKERVLHYSSAGHPPGMMIDASGNINELSIGTIPLGILSEIDVKTESLPFTGETKIILYTDGVIEDGVHTAREAIDHLKTFLQENRTLTGSELLAKIVADYSNDSETAKFDDDVTLIVATVFA